ncbi:uncharacterized protein CTRU02_213688 [Colletotrichum truncatum]|uniref:Uncharacterized protein n=1 Tax=Colletotrichum truncatum TaxID=5467 RepID=A0ACC3YGE9_COLTU|nr:uncharacterized protein CTRU02_11739 [Colletotrichum truncatum]KAF6785439.1 hypothetical protein CTRU02_11739 [Colletotrichum truncatum]
MWEQMIAVPTNEPHPIPPHDPSRPSIAMRKLSWLFSSLFPYNGFLFGDPPENRPPQAIWAAGAGGSNRTRRDAERSAN